MKKVFAFVLTLFTVSNAFTFENEISPSSASNGTIQVRITDSEISNFGLIIEIVNIEVYSPNVGWITLNNYQQSISSMSFTKGDNSLLANAEVPTGNYTKLRLTFGSTNSIYAKEQGNGLTNDLNFASEKDKQVEIDINQNVELDNVTEVLVDFNISNSIFISDNTYVLHPEVDLYEDNKRKDLEAVNDFSTLSSNY